jgi:hypothetical protein
MFIPAGTRSAVSNIVGDPPENRPYLLKIGIITRRKLAGKFSRTAGIGKLNASVDFTIVPFYMLGKYRQGATTTYDHYPFHTAGTSFLKVTHIPEMPGMNGQTFHNLGYSLQHTGARICLPGMRKYILGLPVFLFFSLDSIAQKMNFGIGAEAAVPVFQRERGFGLYGKGFYRVGNSSELTLAASAIFLRAFDPVTQTRTNTRLIPLLIGYKYNLKRFYFEPQVGYGELGGRIQKDGDYIRPSAGAFFWAAGVGLDHKKMMVGIRFQRARGVDGSAAGVWHNRSLHYSALQIGYRLF